MNDEVFAELVGIAEAELRPWIGQGTTDTVANQHAASDRIADGIQSAYVVRVGGSSEETWSSAAANSLLKEMVWFEMSAWLNMGLKGTPEDAAFVAAVIADRIADALDVRPRGSGD